MSKSAVEKIAITYLRKYGKMDQKSAAYAAKLHQAGKLDNPNGYSDQDIKQGLQLVQVLSYQANPSLYESGNGAFEPETGKQLLESAGLKSPYIQQSISEMLGPDHPYSTEVSTLHAAGNTGEALNNMDDGAAPTTELNTDTGLGLDTGAPVEQTAKHPNTGATIHQNEAGGYTRTSSEVFRTEPKAKPLGSVQMNKDGSGGVYTSGLGSGDSRQESAKRAQLQGNTNTATQSGD